MAMVTAYCPSDGAASAGSSDRVGSSGRARYAKVRYTGEPAVTEEVEAKDEVEAKEVEVKMGAILEQLAARFDLVLEAVTGFGGRLDALREEIVGQFSEVGRQVRFISDRIAENREGVAITRADLGAEMVRIGENLGATRIEFREQLASTRHELQE